MALFPNSLGKAVIGEKGLLLSSFLNSCIELSTIAFKVVYRHYYNNGTGYFTVLTSPNVHSSSKKTLNCNYLLTYLLTCRLITHRRFENVSNYVI